MVRAIALALMALVVSLVLFRSAPALAEPPNGKATPVYVLSVWTNDVDHGLEIARRVRTGTYTVNSFMMEFSAPFGGFKSSGLGRELGPEGLSAYLEPKTINLPMGYEPRTSY